MAFCHIVFSVLVLSVVNSVIATSRGPVIIWGDIDKISSNSNPLLNVPAAEFDIRTEVVIKPDSKKIAFVDDKLSVEDFGVKDIDGDSAFPYLQDIIEDALYLPSLEDPLQTLETLANPERTNHIQLFENGLSAPIMLENIDMLFINLKDAKDGESRFDVLSRHDTFMKETVEELQKDHNIVAIYTGRHPSWIPVSHSRARRQVTGTQRLQLSLDHLLLDVTSVALQFHGQNVTLSNMETSSSVLNGTDLNVTLNFAESNSVTLNFISSSGYWSFDSVNVIHSNESEQLEATSEIYALTTSSYRCANEIVFINQNRTVNITFNDLKIQPFFDINSTASENKFGDSFNCVGFFSIPIWSGLFVAFILLIITFYGIMMMMDIRTMDRFDDPKGKTITINANE